MADGALPASFSNECLEDLLAFKAKLLRKAEIVRTVLALADRIGPDRVTTGAAAAAVGVTQAALFRHFPTKAALWLAEARTAGVPTDGQTVTKRRKTGASA